MESPNKCRVNSGFTLVELSIVMIIIGLLIGGIFGGMKLVDNANVQKSVQDLKAVEAAGLTFKDAYRAIPGDMRNPATRLPNCTGACALADAAERGNRILDSSLTGIAPIDNTTERFAAWHQLQAAQLISMDFHNTTADLSFGEGQPTAPVGGGYRFFHSSGTVWNCGRVYNNAIIAVTGSSSINIADAATSHVVPCRQLQSIDIKIDDGVQFNGKFTAAECYAAYTCANSYDSANQSSYGWYDVQGW